MKKMCLVSIFSAVLAVLAARAAVAAPDEVSGIPSITREALLASADELARGLAFDREASELHRDWQELPLSRQGWYPLGDRAVREPSVYAGCRIYEIAVCDMVASIPLARRRC